MLDQETKNKIDSLRQILVGKIPDPKAQVDQITTALIYKFMDDMDQESKLLGGKVEYFSGKFKSYRWGSVIDPRLSGEERFNLYARAINDLPNNEKLPPLFRDVFKNAFLPYRDPETLQLFLKEIDGFFYDNSENLGNAFEYLLSILGSQGDAGQFRTPRHIIDFIVEVLSPTKDDSILDPACGTAGFLISAYKHIERDNSEEYDLDKTEVSFRKGGLDAFSVPLQMSKEYRGSKLKPNERKKLQKRIMGYDISPDMVKLSLVNMYLHRFKEPQIYEYDTLTYENRWGDDFDLILANPPFMSPRGGIRPHNRFSVKSNRSEVLFVDYIAEHLSLNGRAGIIVPEGIIFKGDKAYKQLRKMLVEDNFLWAVASLPAGIFNPYSGVKTSILFLDRQKAKSTKEILFLNIESDGFELGATRRRTEENDLPKACEILKTDRSGKKTKKRQSDFAYWVKKKKIIDSGDWGLSGNKYKEIKTRPTKWPMVALGKVCDIRRGVTITKQKTRHGNIPVIAGGKRPAYYHNVANRQPPVITVSASGAYAGFVSIFNMPIYASDCSTISIKDDFININFIYSMLKNKQDDIYRLQKGGGQPHVYPKDLEDIMIPCPPLDIQKEIIAEVERYQKIIDGAKQIVDNWKPTIKVDPKWPKVELGEVGKISMCKRIFKKETTPKGEIPFYKIGTFGRNPDSYISRSLYNQYRKKYSFPKKGEVLLSASGTIGRRVIYDGTPSYFQDSNIVWVSNDESRVLNTFLYHAYSFIQWPETTE